MSTIREAAKEYLRLRRGLGYKLYGEGRLLEQFVDFLEERHPPHLRVEAALEWATQPPDADPQWRAARLSVVRVFARYLATLDEHTEVPPEDLLPRHGQRTQPFLYSAEEIAALMRAARALASPLRAATFEAFIGLMAVTGMRTGEAMGLDRDEVDFTEGVLLVQGTKFGKSRLVPLHSTATDQLRLYGRLRDELCPRPSTPAFFVSGAGTRLNHTNAGKTFTRLLRVAGIAAPPGTAEPRLYDLRHSFAVATLVTWYAQDADVAHQLPALSTYLGHISPATTTGTCMPARS